jgi:hypothetical protein
MPPVSLNPVLARMPLSRRSRPPRRRFWQGRFLRSPPRRPSSVFTFFGRKQATFACLRSFSFLFIGGKRDNFTKILNFLKKVLKYPEKNADGGFFRLLAKIAQAFAERSRCGLFAVLGEKGSRNRAP